MTDFLNTASPLVQADDDASKQFEVFVNRASDKAVMDWFNNYTAEAPPQPLSAPKGADSVSGSTPGSEAQGSGAGDPVANTPKAETPAPQGLVGSLKQSFLAFHEGSQRAPQEALQIVGGVVDAFDEASTFIEEIVGLGGVQILDENGNLDVKRLTSEEFLKREDTLFDKLTPAEGETGEEKFIRSTSQFMSAFLPVLGGLKGLNFAKNAPFAAEMVAGAVADFIAFDPHGDRLSTYLNEVPVLGAIVPDYLADNDPQNESRWEGRLKNAIEGAGLGLAVEPLFRVFKYYKAARGAEAHLEQQGAAFDAGRDAIKDAAEADLIEPVEPEALRPLGDPDGDFIVQNLAGDKTLGNALERLEGAKRRVREADEKTGLLGRVNSVIDAVAAKSGAVGGKLADGRAVMDDLIDQVRVGVKAPRMPKRPVGEIFKKLGGIHPDGQLAAQLRGAGITAKTSPGLFRRGPGAIMDGDNIPISEHQIFLDNAEADGLNVPVQAIIDGLSGEAAGSPLRTLDEQRILAELVEPVDQFSQALDELGIDVRSMDNESVKRRLKEVEEEAERLRLTQDVPDIEDTAPEGFDPELEDLGTAVARTADDLQKEIADDIMPPTATGYDANGKAIKQPVGSKIFLNHARIRSAEDVKGTIQAMMDQDAAELAAQGVGVRQSNKAQIKASDKEFKDLADLLGRDPGPMSASEALAARRLLVASGEQVVNLARLAASPSATKEDLFNFRRSTVVHYAVQSEVLKARTETARALQSWSVSMGSNKQAANVVCVL